MNALFQGAVDVRQIDKTKAVEEINALIKWQEERKKWHHDKTRQKMAAENTASTANGTAVNSGDAAAAPPGSNTFHSSDFGLDESDLADLQSGSESESEGDDVEDGDVDAIAGERKRRAKVADKLKRTAGEPVKPEIRELEGLKEGFLSMLRMVLAD